MLYKFQSRATADLIMLEANGRQFVQIMGKTPGQSGIITAAQIPAAIAAIEAAIAADEQAQAAPQEDKDDQPVRLRQRAVPLLDMLRRSAAEGRDVTW